MEAAQRKVDLYNAGGNFNWRPPFLASNHRCMVLSCAFCRERGMYVNTGACSDLIWIYLQEVRTQAIPHNNKYKWNGTCWGKKHLYDCLCNNLNSSHVKHKGDGSLGCNEGYYCISLKTIGRLLTFYLYFISFLRIGALPSPIETQDGRLEI